jgi:hypothetical protein
MAAMMWFVDVDGCCAGTGKLLARSARESCSVGDALGLWRRRSAFAQCKYKSTYRSGWWYFLSTNRSDLFISTKPAWCELQKKRCSTRYDVIHSRFVKYLSTPLDMFPQIKTSLQRHCTHIPNPDPADGAS